MPGRGSWLEPNYSLRLVYPFVTYLQSLDLPMGALVDQLAKQALDTRIPVRVALRLLDSGVAFTGMPDLGLRAAMALGYGTCDVLQFAAASAPSFGGALDNILRYIRILNESAQFTLDVRGDVAFVELRSSLEINRAASDFQVAVLAKAAKAWLGNLGGFEFWFAHEQPADLAPYRQVFGAARIRFAAPSDAIVFSAAQLSAPMPSADPALHEVLRRHADHLLSLVPETPSLIPRVREVLVELLKTASTDASTVAARLGMSRRTLTRHLEREKVTFSELLEQLRHELALSYLHKTDHDVQQIAFLLGYSLTAAFSRAFRRWEGKSPNEYRRSLIRGASPTRGDSAALTG
jgi:AraC-like DNA-binding protein